MALNLSSAAIIEKNKLGSTGAWLALLEIIFSGLDPIKICNNTENVTWPSSGGSTWQAFPYVMEELNEAAGEVSQFVIRVSNVTRALQYYLAQGAGGVGATVKLRLVHSAHLDLTTPEVELEFEVLDVQSDDRWVTFTLGGENFMGKRFPRSRILKNTCRYRRFKGSRCGYTGAETTCDRTLARCRALNNSERFGGAPGVGRSGLYI